MNGRPLTRPAREDVPPAWQTPILAAALLIGLVLMAIQLWLLTVALDMLLAGEGRQVWLLAIVSGLIFGGGIMVLWLLGKGTHRTGLPPT